MHRKASWLFGLALLAGCADQAQQAASLAVCTVTKTADVPLSFVHGHVAAAVLIEGKPAIMLVDTGSETTVVTPDAVQAYRLLRDPHRITNVNGTGGVIAGHNALVQSFGIGGLEVLDQSYAVAPIPDFSLVQSGVMGALGADWLTDYDVEIDLPARRMGLFTVDGCTGDYLPWAGPRSRVVASLFGRGLVLVPVRVNGVRLVALLDSGANGSVMSGRQAALLGVDATELASDRSERSEGVDGQRLVTHLHIFSTLEVGGQQTKAPHIAVTDGLHLPSGAQMLLGLDWLRTHRVWIGYGSHHLFVQNR